MKKLICVVIIFLVSNCAFPAKKEGMLVTDYKVGKKIGDKIFVRHSTGGSATLPFWISKISNDNFTDAVEESLLESKAFTSLSDNWGDSWGLKMEIKSLDQPMLGLDFNVTTVVKYVLYLKDKEVYNTTIRATGLAGVSDAFTAVARMRIANERSARANIEKFIIELEKLPNLQ